MLSIAYASEDSRPVAVRVRGKTAVVCRQVTTGFGDGDVEWFRNLAVIDLGPAGRTTVEFKAIGFLPHMSKFQLTPEDPALHSSDSKTQNVILKLSFGDCISAPSSYEWDGILGVNQGSMQVSSEWIRFEVTRTEF